MPPFAGPRLRDLDCHHQPTNKRTTNKQWVNKITLNNQPLTTNTYSRFSRYPVTMSVNARKDSERLHGPTELNTVEMVFAHGSGYQAQQDALEKSQSTSKSETCWNQHFMCQNFSKLLRTEVTKFESFFFQIIFQKTYSKDLLALMASLHLPNRSVACKVTTWNLENNSAHRCDLVESGKESLVSATTGGFGAASEQLFVYVKIFSPFFLVCFFTFNHSCHSCVFFHNFFMFTQLPKPQ